MDFTINDLIKLKTFGKPIGFMINDKDFLQKIDFNTVNNVSSRLVYYWKQNKKPISINNLIDICKKNQIKEISVSQLSVSGGNIINLPDTKDLRFYYLFGLILGDGCLVIRKRDHNRRSYSLQITLRYKDEAIFISEMIQDLFNIKPSIYKGRGCYDVCTFSKSLVILLNKIYSLPVGKKYKNLKVPKIVRLDKEYIRYFVKGVFDSDGNIYKHRNKNAVQLRQKSFKFINQIRLILVNLDIEFNKPYYDIANDSWLLWSSKGDLVNKFIKDVMSINLHGPVAQLG